MVKENFDLEKYLTAGVENIVKNAVRATLKDPKESLFMAKFALASQQASNLRQAAKIKGEHIPPFLIASITSKCNLHCAGCYARANHSCEDGAATNQMTDEEWAAIFSEAKALGIGFILLAGGEPLIRKNVIEKAGENQEIFFPIFTNGTLLNEEYITLFDRCRNLFPVFSIEGEKSATDERRGNGVYQRIFKAMDSLKENHLIFGASITVTVSNYQEVTAFDFLNQLDMMGCKAVFYVEYVPVTKESRHLAMQDAERMYLRTKLVSLREKHKNMLFLSFPGDEKSSGGCLAAGRGFFHINSQGGAEPCPFSPYSDISVKDTSIKQALNSRLFRCLNEQNLLMEEHVGGCLLFEQRETVEKILEEPQK